MQLANVNPKATRMSLELADISIQYPRGIIENVLIKVDKFVLPNDFVILDRPKDSRIPIILGRPFLATARAMIDVFNKKITLRVGDDKVIFDVDQSIKRLPNEDDECYGIDDLDNTINAEAQELLVNDEPNSCPGISRTDKNQREFVGGSWSDSGEEDDEKIQDETCLVAQAPNECRVIFSEHDSEITKDGKVIGRGIRKKGLYVMKLGNKSKDKICLATIDEISTLWHRRLGHANMRLI
ncbi:DNA-directed DNA polymerase [Tanacetum coccineum]